ncbi:C-x8-C-x5-C-x3-H type zinc finger protein [Thermoascus aurantiacus ATCC 26904]
MEQSSAQNNVVPHPSVSSGALNPEYWSSIDPLYPSEPEQQPPLGITWDHPVFHQQQHHQQHQQHQNHVQAPQEHSQGLFSQAPQSWHHQSPPLQQHSISPAPQGYAIPHQYQLHHHYPQGGHVTYDSRSLAPSNNPSYQPYSFSQNYYHHPQHLSVPDAFSQPAPRSIQQQQPARPAAISPNSLQTPMTQIPANCDQHTPIHFSNGYHESPPNVTYQQTINPQFLTAPQHPSSQPHVASHNDFLVVNPADFERPETAKSFPQLYRQDFQRSPALGQPTSDQSALGQLAPPQTAPPQNSPQQHAPQQSTPQQNVAPQNIAPAPQTDNATAVKEEEPSAAAAAKPAKAAAPKKKKASSTKPSQPRVKKTASKPAAKKQESKSSSSSSSESDDSDDSELEVEAPEEPSPIPPTRPEDPEAAAEYDALQAVWSPRNRRPNVEKIKSALVAFKDVVKAVRDTWKEKSQAMKTAENQSENDKAAELKKEVILQRRLMDVVVTTTLEKGHPIIVEKLGEHPIAVSAMYSFLLDRHQASDFDGTLTVNILKLLARFVTMDEDVLQKTNVAKLLPRFVKRGGQTVKELAQKIMDNAAASTKRKQEAAKAASKDESASKSPAPETSGDAPRTESVAGTKRPREGEKGESNGQPATKRTVTPSGAKSATKADNGAATSGKSSTETKAESKPSSATGNTAALRPKANIVAPKPTSLFGSLASASKKPGTSNAARAAAAAAAAASAKEKASAATEKKETPPPPPPKPTFSFGDIMADLNKQRDSISSKPAEDRPPETEEERKKRLRKEERRKLRVKWKPDDCLTEVRLFKRDPEEVPGDGAIRGAGDIREEGRMLKLHKDVEDLEDEEEIGLREEGLRTYQLPSEIDFSVIEAEDRTRNFTKRGGSQEPTSREKQAQEQREATTLMVFHTSPADIPPSPKEPPPPSAEELTPEEEVPFGEPPDHVKARQARYYAAMNPQTTVPPQPAPPTGPIDIANLLKIIQKAPQQQQPTPPPQPVQQSPFADLERTINMFRQQQGQPPLPQFPQLPVSQPPPSQGIDFQKILAVINAQKQMQQQNAFPQPPQSQPSIPPNLAAIISQLTSQNQQNAQAQSQPQQQQNQIYEDPERKRLREMSAGYDGANDDRYGQAKRSKVNGDAKQKKHPKAGLVACRYWREGKCLKGDDCTFRHDPLD